MTEVSDTGRDKPTNITRHGTMFGAAHICNPCDGGKTCYDEGEQAAERRIIEWLRNGCGREWTVVHPKDVADAIERGEHRG